MKILWFCSFPPASVAKARGKSPNRFGGWIDGALKALASAPNISLFVCYPQVESKDIIIGDTEYCQYFGIHTNKDISEYDSTLKDDFDKIIKLVNPNAIHFWGAEFPFFYAAVQAINHSIPSICSIQGLCGIYATHYYANLPEKIYRKVTFRDLVRKDSIIKQKSKYILRGKYEELILGNVEHVIGRTEWDRALAGFIAPQAIYHHCNETLRDMFYIKANSWCYDTCEKHSIFVSQSGYPIKGFHNAIEALRMVIVKYPDSIIYTTGNNPFDIPWYRRSAYQDYLKGLIYDYGLTDNVVFMGALDQNQMCERFLKSNVFVSSSSIENSPNSVGEAMLLGVPVVASYVGGTMNLLSDKKDGYLYQADAPYMLAYYINKVFDAGNKAKTLGEAGYKHALSTHNPEINLKDLISIYKAASNGEQL